MEINPIQNISITEEDIAWAESILKHKFQFDSQRRAIIQNLSSVDVQAFPGSGKTTVLVAKLAILARKWPFTHVGICVLSHTNVAREEIEGRLGNTEVGKRLLSYPHFIGTFHSFFDTHIALPWLRSKGIKINMIDTMLVQKQRWANIPKNIRSGLECKNIDESICSYKECVGNLKIGKINPQTNTYKAVLSAIENSQNQGNFTFDEVLLYAQEALDKSPSFSKSIAVRFPLLFIDEAQDTNSFQWNLIYKAFGFESDSSIYQGFGDKNQAIYSYINENSAGTEFPRKDALFINKSQRFDDRIATLANSVALSNEKMKGSDNNLSDRQCPHTIYVFSKENTEKVIDEFGKLILATFSDEELMEHRKEGCHVIGMVHDKKDETPDKQFPKGIYDYWSCYEAQKANKNRMPQSLIEYCRRGQEEMSKTGETSAQVEWIAKGLRRLINRGRSENYIIATCNPFTAMNRKLSFAKQVKFRNAIGKLMSSDIASEEKWNNLLDVFMEILSMFDGCSNPKVNSFLGWTNNVGQDENTCQKHLVNQYSYRDSSGRSVNLEFGSIHSVKGRTHLATLVLETFSRAHNLKSILPYLCNTPPKSVTSQNQVRLKCQYVAMTRARALLCIAIPVEFVDDKSQTKLKSLGWNLKLLIE